jgi:hypothetical protein
MDFGVPQVDEQDMAAAGHSRPGNDRGAPRLLEHCAVYERMLGAEGRSARARLDGLLGDELASLLCRALMSAPRPAAMVAF